MSDVSSPGSTPGRRWSGIVSRRSLLAGGVLGFGLAKVLDHRGREHEQLPELPPPGSDEDAPALRFLVVGDIGLDGETRDLVVEEMKRCMGEHPAAAVLFLGDNFYPDGVASVDDPQWRTKFEDLFPESLFPVPFYACLGNHDYNGSTQAQIDYTQHSTRWRMPKEYHSFRQDVPGGGTVEVFALDTQRVWKDHSANTPQLAWLADGLARSTATWKLVLGHHPVRSCGVHGPFGEVARRLEGLLTEHHVDLYLSGHDHDLQLLRTGEPWLQVVSGAGSCLRETFSCSDTLFSASKPGFVELAIRPEELRIEFHVAREGVVHAHSMRRHPVFLPASYERGDD